MKGWEIKKLGEVTDLIARGVAPKYLETGGTRVLNQKCVRDHDINFDLARHHDHAVKSVAKDRFIQVGDVLVNSTGTGTLGRVAQVRQAPNEATTVDTHVTIVRPKAGKFFPDFFGYMLIKIEDEITASGEGASGQTELSRTTLAEKFDVSFPNSITEQRRIVAILDETFAGLASMRANAQNNLKNARALFDSHLNEIFAQKGEGWVETTLGQIAEFKNGLNYTQSSKGQTVRIVGVKDFQNYFWMPSEGLDSVQIDGALPTSYELQNNDILTVRSNGNKQLIGRCILARGVEEKTAHSGFTIRIRVEDRRIDPVFLTRYLKTDIIRQTLVESGDGANISSLNQQALARLPVAFPNEETQGNIVRKLDEWEEESTRLEALYRQKLAAIDELKQSILQKAFSGELTANVELAA